MKERISYFYILLPYSFCFLLCLNFIPDLYGAVETDIEKKVTSNLINFGFENVIVKEIKNSLIVSYENRIYRNESEGCAEVVKVVSSILTSPKNIVLIPKLRGIPIITIKIPVAVLNQLIVSGKSDFSNIDVSMDTDIYSNQIEKSKSENSSKLKVDVIVHPQVKARFGNFEKIGETQINLAPELKSSLWKGMSFSSQIVFPLHNELDSIGDYVRPGLVTVNQLIRLPFNSFASGTLGYFSDKRYGADLEIKNYLLNGKVSLGFNFGYTGMAFYQKGIWHYSNETTVTSLASASYRYAPLDLSLKISYGRYLQKDKGVRLEINRQFGETEIGFFCSRTSLSNNGGFYFSIPLFPAKFWKIKTVRVRPAESFPWEYRYKTIDDDLRTYDTGNRIDVMIKNFNPDFFKKQLIIYLKKNNKGISNENSK